MASNRLRLKLTTGAELEVEGDAEFVRQEREEFLLRQTPAPAPLGAAQAGPQTEPRVDWNAVVEARKGGVTLRGKLPGGDQEGREACLVLILASERLLSQPRPTATLLAKWLRASGYPIARLDRTIQDAVSQGELLSSGSRRSRRYELTAPGKIRALLLAERMTAAVTGRH